MAVSDDGYTFTALNDGKPVIAGDTIALQKGTSDPHIFRGPDGAFYLSMTDLHIYAQKTASVIPNGNVTEKNTGGETTADSY